MNTYSKLRSTFQETHAKVGRHKKSLRLTDSETDDREMIFLCNLANKEWGARK